MKEIELTQGKVALVDDEDYDYINQFRWCAQYNSCTKTFYAVRAQYIKKKDKGDHPNKKQFSVRMHRVILGVTDPELYVDHVNGDTLDNRKKNLRTCTPSQNARNRTKPEARNITGFRGVSRAKNTTNKVWKAQIRNHNGKKMGIGYYLTPEEAARAFDKAALEIYGEFCGKLNFEDSKEIFKKEAQ